MSFDPELMQDFLTESGELLDQLDHDLVTLESTPQDLELVNRIFRALHTIKGSASFLTLTNLVSVAHAAETALNDARNRVYVIDRAAMDLLLAAVDTIKKQFDNIRAGEELISPDAALCEKLIALGAKPGATSAHAHHSAHAATPVFVGAGASSGHASVPAFASGDPFTLPEAQSQPFTLPPNKADLVEFLAADVEATLDQIQQQLSRLGQDSMRSSAASTITDLADALVRSVDFFGVEPMTRLATLLKQIGAKGADLPKQAADTVGSQAGKAVEMLRETSKGLVSGQLVQRPLTPTATRSSHS